MRSVPPSHGNRSRRRSPREVLDATAHLIDEGTLNDPGHVLVHVTEEHDDVVLGVRSLPTGVHPFGELAGFISPPEWSMVGLRVRGTARHLDQDRPAEPVSTTYLVHRTSEECSLLRVGGVVRDLPAPAEGTLPDLCRRVFELPTAPAPASTALLWTLVWLDRVLEGWSDPTHRRRLTSSWPDVAALHPAACSAPAMSVRRPVEPSELAARARTHAGAWPWSRLRAQPGEVHLPDAHVSAEVAAWMDDGFFARWALGSFPPAATLGREVIELLDGPVADRVVRTLRGLLQ